MVLKLYGSPWSTCTRRVTTILYEKQLPYELIPIDFFKGEHKSEEYLQKQPFGLVPYIDDDGFIVYESRAIAWYLATKYADQGTALIPATLQGQALVQQAISCELAHFVWAEKAVSENIMKPRYRRIPSDPELFKSYIKELDTRLDAYERILSTTEYLAGDEITICDLFHLPYADLLKEAGTDILESEKRPNVLRWFNNIRSRDSWVANKDLATPHPSALF